MNNNTVDLIFEIELRGQGLIIKKITFIGDKKIKENKLKKNNQYQKKLNFGNLLVLENF